MKNTFRFSKEAYKELRGIIVARKEAIAQGKSSIKVMHPLRQITVDFIGDKVNVTAHGESTIKAYGKHYTLKW